MKSVREAEVETTLQTHFYGCIRVFLVLSLLLLAVKVAAYIQDWHLSVSQEEEVDAGLQAVDGLFAAAYAAWMRARLDLTSVVLSGDPAIAAEWAEVALWFPTTCLAYYSFATMAWMRLEFSVAGSAAVEHYDYEGRSYVGFKSRICICGVDGDAPAVIPLELELEHIDVGGDTSDDDDDDDDDDKLRPQALSAHGSPLHCMSVPLSPPASPSFTRTTRFTPSVSSLGRFFRGPRIPHGGFLSGAYSYVCIMQSSVFLSLSQQPDTCSSKEACIPKVMRGHPYPQPTSFPWCTSSFLFPVFFTFYFSTVCPCFQRLRAALVQEDPVHPGVTRTGAHPTNSPPPGIRHPASTCTAGDEISTHSSVAWCGFHLRLSRPFFNRRMARSFHLAVLAFGDTSAYRRRVCLRLRRLLCSISVDGPSCNTAFAEGLFCKMAA